MTKTYTRKGITYYRDIAEAMNARDAARSEFPAARIVHYTLGWAVQVKLSGDYLGPNGRPSDEAR
jgi:hypothetical protein